MKRTSKILVWGLGISLIAILAVLWTCNQIVASNAVGKTCDEIDRVQYREVGLLLGTTPQTRIGNRRNWFFKYRIDATEELYKNGKIRKILISGDENSLDGINEPECMRDSLVARGFSSEDIMLGGKGFRTIFSVIMDSRVSRLSPSNFITSGLCIRQSILVWMWKTFKPSMRQAPSLNWPS